MAAGTGVLVLLGFAFFVAHGLSSEVCVPVVDVSTNKTVINSVCLSGREGCSKPFLIMHKDSAFGAIDEVVSAANITDCIQQCFRMAGRGSDSDFECNSITYSPDGDFSCYMDAQTASSQPDWLSEMANSSYVEIRCN